MSGSFSTLLSLGDSGAGIEGAATSARAWMGNPCPASARECGL